MFAYIPHELHFLQKLLAYRPEVLDPAFIFFNGLDKGPTYCLIAIMVFTLLNPTLGKRCFILLGLCIMSNYFFKELFMQPRPLVLDPSLGLVDTESRYGLPSGAAEATTALAVFLMHYYKKNWMKVLAIAYVALVCVSRIYIGMHFMSDVLVGALIGYLLAKVFIHTIEPFEHTVAKIPSLLLCVIIGFLMAIAAFTSLVPAYQMGIGIISGVLFVDTFLKEKSATLEPLLCKRKILAFTLTSFGLLGLITLRRLFPLSLVLYTFILVNLVAMVTYLSHRILTKTPRVAKGHPV